jgi:glycosyltransferase involved in cell wall biosynthesis
MKSLKKVREPKVSVIIPTYNRKKLVVRAIKSVINQTYRNWELIIVDDGSTDNTKEAIKPFLENKKIKYFYQKNKGVCAARNLGIQKAKGEYIALLDSDDEYLAGKLEKQILEMKKGGASFSLCNYFVYLDSKKEQKKQYFNNPKNKKFFFVKTFDLITTRVPRGACLMVFKRKISNKLKFDPSIPAFNDLDFLLRLKREKIIFITEPLARVEKSASRERISTNYSKKIKGGSIILEKMRKGKYDLSLEEKKLLEKVISFNLGFFSLLNSNFKEGRKFLNRGIALSDSPFEKLKYRLIYITSFLPPLFKTLTFVGRFFWKLGLVKI